MLTVNVFTWFGITYWDQMHAIWYFELSCVSVLTHVPRSLMAESTAVDGSSMAISANAGSSSNRAC